MYEKQNILEQVLKEDFRKNCSSVCKATKENRILSEREFKDRLYKERKRSERSKSPMSVVFINLSRGTKSSSRNWSRDKDFYRQLNGIVDYCTRDTDFVGWYECQQVLGIIYVDTQRESRDIVIERLKNKIVDSENLQINSEIDIAALTFPLKDLRETDSVTLTVYPKKRDTFNDKMSLTVKRIFDYLGTIGCILLFLPLFLLIPILIKLDSKGPVFYLQKRVGEGGKIFHLYKFRSMHVNTNDNIHRTYVTQLIKGDVDNKQGIYKIKDDPRVTRVGKILRKFSFDEIPQFFNVLKGEMSLVGPRPPIPYETAEYELWHLRRIMECKPGITGLWQVEGRSKTNFDEMVRMDLNYIEKRSLFLDLKIVFKTPWVLLTARGAF